MEMKFSNDMQELLEESHRIAVTHKNSTITPAHLLAAMLSASPLTMDIVTALSSPEQLAEMRSRLLSYIVDCGGDTITEVKVGDLTNRVLKLSLLEARLLKDSVIHPLHLLLSILHNREYLASDYSGILTEGGITYERVYSYARDGHAAPADAEDSFVKETPTAEFATPGEEEPRVNPSSHTRPASKSKSDTPVLDKFSTDLTKAAADGRLDPVVGREVEIERLAQILSRRKKNNPVLIGEPGVGKSAIVEGLAIRIVNKQVSRILYGKRVVSLDLTGIVAGTKYRGEFEERIKAILGELTKNRDIILFIDEIHNIVGAGNTQGSMDAANILKPALARGELQCIGATTLDEYRKNIEKDGALERRFQKVMVEPTTAEQTLAILHNIKGQYEKHHNVTYTDAALEACVKLTERYISDRNFPDKAIDAMDEAGSRSHISNVEVPEVIERLEIEIEEANAKKVEAANAGNYNEAAKWRDKTTTLREKLAKAQTAWDKEMESRRQVIDEDLIAEVVAMMTGVPVQRIAQAEGIRLLEMAPHLKSEIIGQNEAIEKIVKAIQRNRIGLKDPNKPIGTFMFLGPTGVGKTYLAKKLAEYLFDSADTLIRIDMSEYMEKFTVSRLIGAPPGYVGYEEGGQLTEKVRRHPYSVVLLDEIEKAHPDVFNLLLQLMDEGRLTDSLGRHIDFKNTIVIMTSNIGTRQLKDFGSGVGFTTREIDKDYSHGVLRKALNKAFSPEFLNRIDDIVMFDSLDKDSLYKIIDLELKAFRKRLKELNYELEITEEAKEYIASKGYDIQFGARPMKRAIQKYLEDPLAELIITATLLPGNLVRVDYDKDKDEITTSVISKMESETPHEAEVK